MCVARYARALWRDSRGFYGKNWTCRSETVTKLGAANVSSDEKLGTHACEWRGFSPRSFIISNVSDFSRLVDRFSIRHSNTAKRWEALVRYSKECTHARTYEHWIAGREGGTRRSHPRVPHANSGNGYQSAVSRQVSVSLWLAWLCVIEKRSIPRSCALSLRSSERFVSERVPAYDVDGERWSISLSRPAERR